MQLSGEHFIDAPALKIWQLLMDIDALAKITPGVSAFIPKAENLYTAVSTIKLGPVNASFTGEMELRNIEAPTSFTLVIKQNSKIGNAAAEVRIFLQENDQGNTKVSFEGDAKLSGMLASMGNRVLTGVSNTLSKQFFDNLQEELKLNH